MYGYWSAFPVFLLPDRVKVNETIKRFSTLTRK
jgi:hypothetical protein